MIAYILLLLMQVTESDKMIPTVLHFGHIANGQILEQNKNIAFGETKTYTIKQWKYYISHLEFIQADKKTIAIPGVFLIDAFAKDSIILQLPKAKYSGIKFSIGIDSAIQMSGAQEGDLDPLKGMYWAWNTGYIHFKLEGEKQMINNTAERFQYHIGGFAAENNTMQELKFAFIKNISINEKKAALPFVMVDAAKFLDNKILENEKPLIMKEGKNAVAISTIFPSLFTITINKNGR